LLLPSSVTNKSVSEIGITINTKNPVINVSNLLMFYSLFGNRGGKAEPAFLKGGSVTPGP
jgi:hypothetical protein